MASMPGRILVMASMSGRISAHVSAPRVVIRNGSCEQVAIATPQLVATFTNNSTRRAKAAPDGLALEWDNGVVWRRVPIDQVDARAPA